MKLGLNFNLVLTSPSGNQVEVSSIDGVTPSSLDDLGDKIAALMKS